MSRLMFEEAPVGATLVSQPPRTQVIAVTSGKGGVGKTNLAANVAVALAQKGKHVLLLDADLGLGNVDVLLGLVPRLTLNSVLSGTCSLSEIVLPGPAGIQVLPASSGIAGLTTLTPVQQLVLRDELERVARAADFLLVDTAAGISSNVTFFAAAAHAIVLVVSPEPTSLTDAYALMKVLLHQYRERQFHIVVNMAKTQSEAMHVFHKLDRAADRFLHLSTTYVGMIPYDDYVPLAVTEQQAVLQRFPQAPSSRAFTRLAQTITQWPTPTAPKGTVQLLWSHEAPSRETA